jgi:hypothetical protein
VKQELGETSQAMTAGLMKKIHRIVEQDVLKEKKYYILVHAKPSFMNKKLIKQGLVVCKQKPPQMLSTLLFRVDRETNEVVLEWALPGDWPKHQVENTGAFDETIMSSIDSVGHHHYVHGASQS